MGVLGLILGILGGLCTVVGIITAAEVIPVFFRQFDGIFWLMLAGVLFLACIACVIGRGGYE